MTEEIKADTMQKPGNVLRPQISQKTVISAVERLYGVRVEKIREQNSYDDRNYHITVNSDYSNSNIEELWPHGYVFKVLNEIDSQKKHVEAEHEIEHILSTKGFNCPVPVPNVHGKDTSLEKFYVESDETNVTEENENIVSDDSRPFKIHLVRLLKFIPGKIFHQVPYTPRLLYQLGEYLAKFHKATEGYYHHSFNNFKMLWSLESFPRVREFTYAVKDDKYSKTVKEVFDAFDAEVIPNYPKYQRGFIHGDINEQNIIVRERNQDGVNENGQGEAFDVHGVIDFSDCLDSYYLFDVGIAIMHFSVHSTSVDPLLVPGHILAGYLSQRELNEAEFDALRLTMAARYTVSLVMGAYTYLQDPSNTYVLTTAKQGWQQLENLWQTPKEELYDKWKRIIQQYN